MFSPTIFIFFFIFFFLCNTHLTISSPQTNLLNSGCSHDNATNTTLFFSNLNTTFSNLQSKISSFSISNLSATSETPSASLYGLFFCRSYLSRSDCLACLSAAISLLTSRCKASTGGRVILDGCTLRYESTPFFDQGTALGDTNVCGNQSTTTNGGFAAAVTAMAKDLSLADPEVAGFSAAVEGDGAFVAAQCADTLSKDVCSQCLQVAYGNIVECLPAVDGRAVDAGCFMRYSNSRFFLANQTVDLSRYLGASGI